MAAAHSPRAGEAIDDAQKWAVACTRAALLDYGWPGRPLDQERTAVILGNAMGGGEKHYQTARRIAFPETARDLAGAPSFRALPAEVRAAITAELHERMDAQLPQITGDTMPGELGNCVAGRVANLFDLRGPNFVVDAACASTLAALATSIEGLVQHKFDTAISGDVDRNMGPWMFVKLSRMGALSATGSRPFDAAADGFVMGEGAAVFVLKRLQDAERAGDRIYAVVRGIGAASDGRGKAIAAPNPVGQRLAVQRAWRDAGLSPATCSMVEAHGTSTPVGDVVEVNSITEAFASAGLPPGSVALGSVKSNIGHLPGRRSRPAQSDPRLAREADTGQPGLRASQPQHRLGVLTIPGQHPDTALGRRPRRQVRCAAVSAFGFGGTNFHAVVEEYVPGRAPGSTSTTTTAAADRPGS